MLLLSMADRDWAMFCYGSHCEYAFNSYGQEKLEKVFLDNFGEDDWYGGFEDYVKECRVYLEKAANGKRGGSKPKANRKQTESNIEGEIEVEGEVEREEENQNDSYIPPTPSATEGAAKNYWGFDQFWDVYPKKSAKKDAFDAWKRVDPDEGKVKRILEAVKQQKLWPQYSGENARYFPSPSKWLDGGCWDDEPLAGEEDPYAKFT